MLLWGRDRSASVGGDSSEAPWLQGDTESVSPGSEGGWIMSLPGMEDQQAAQQSPNDSGMS